MKLYLFFRGADPSHPIEHEVRTFEVHGDYLMLIKDAEILAFDRSTLPMFRVDLTQEKEEAEKLMAELETAQSLESAQQQLQAPEGYPVDQPEIPDFLPPDLREFLGNDD